MPKKSFCVTFAAALLFTAFACFGQGSDAAQRNEEIRRRNEQITANNAIVARTFAAGNAAFQAGNLDEAIAQYNEGLAADADQVALLANKSQALNRRGIERYNTAVKATDPALKSSGKAAAASDWKESFAAASHAVEVVKATPGMPAPNVISSYLMRAEAGKLLLRTDASVADAVFRAWQEYGAVEPDEGKKLKAQIDAAQALLDGGLADRAVTEFRKLVTANEYNLDAVLGLGMALFTTGEEPNFKEAATYIQRFVKQAPDSHPQKPKARQLLRELGPYVGQ